MSRIARQQAISPKHFKHFAAATIGITTLIALFADGSGADPISAEVSARSARNDLLRAEADKLGSRRVAVKNLHLRAERRSYFAFAPDEPEPATNAVGSTIAQSNDDMAQPGVQPARRGPGKLRIAPRQRGQTRFSHRIGESSGSAVSEQQIDALEAASRERSGAPTE